MSLCIDIGCAISEVVHKRFVALGSLGIICKYCLFGVNYFLKLWSNIEASIPLRNDLKSCQRHRNDLSVWRQGVCPSKIKTWGYPLDPKCRKWICVGKWAFKILAELFLKNEKASDDRAFFTQCVRYHSPGVNRFHQESSSRDEETIHKLKPKFSIFAKMTILRPLTPTFGLGQSSISLPILIRWWQTMAR